MSDSVSSPIPTQSESKDVVVANTEIIKVGNLRMRKNEDGRLVVTTDKRSEAVRMNNFKTGKFMKLPAYCDSCELQPSKGKPAKCPKYERHAVCGLRKDITSAIGDANIRDPEVMLESLRRIHDVEVEDYYFSKLYNRMKGNKPDNSDVRLNAVIRIATLINELSMVTIKSQEMKATKHGDDIDVLFKQVLLKHNPSVENEVSGVTSNA